MLLLLLPSLRAEDPPAWGPVDSTYRVHIPAEGPLTVELTWHLVASRPGWWEGTLVGPGLVVSAVTGPAVPTREGLRAALAPGSDTATIVVRGTLDPTAAGSATLAVLPSPRQRVILDAPGLDAEVAGALDGWLAGADRLAVSWRPHVDVAPVPPSPLLRAEAATAVWAETGALVSRSRVRWSVLRGEVARFELDVAGLDEVEVTGPALASATRAGDRMVLTPRSPVRGSFEVDVRARAPVGEGDTAAPAPRPVATRVERFWTVGRAEDGELVPVGGPRSVPLRTVPEWGRGLSETPLESAWAGDTPLQVRVARFSPLMGPDTVIERAEIVVAAAREGRALVRTTWDVRNERRQYLHVTPPPGLRPMTARVSGVAALVLADGAGGLYVPLEKSVETVQGLLTFPVEITWFAEGEAWERRGERIVAVPAVDAPIQDARWQVYLPRGATAKGAHPAAPPPEAPAGGEELQRAVAAYKANDFEQAQEWLDHAKASGSESANVERLQSNLDVLLAEETEDDAPEDVAARRVRSLANAKTVTLQVEQEKKAEEARKAYERGDVEEAERQLEEVIVLSGKIGATEQKESAEQADKRDEATELLSQVKKSKAERSGLGSSGYGRGGGGSVSTGSGEGMGWGSGEGAAATVVSSAGVLAVGSADEGDDSGMEPPPEEAPAPQAPVVTPVPATSTTVAATPPSGRAATSDEDDGTPAVDFATSANRRVIKTIQSRPKRSGKDAAAAGIDFESVEVQTLPPPPPAPPPILGDTAALRESAARGPVAEPAKPVEARAALEVQAAPLTLALPLGGLLVEDRAALLPAGAVPTLTVPYHFPREPR